MFRGLITLVFCLGTAVIALAGTIHIPADYPTIQGGIDAASLGDTVLVGPGTYYENIDFAGKGVILLSRDGAEYTVIDGQEAGSVVSFINGEDAAAILGGFTLTNGWGSNSGGGILCSGSSPIIVNNTIRDNIGAGGGGIACLFGAAPIILDNCISENYGMVDGGGIYVNNSSPEIRRNNISLNWVNPQVGHGGGILCTNYGQPVVTGNRIWKNQGGIKGGGIHCGSYSLAIVTNNEIFLNRSTQYGGGIACSAWSEPILVNNTIGWNKALYMGGGISAEAFCEVTLSNSILWENKAPDGKELFVGSIWVSSISASYCDIQGGLASAHVVPGSTLTWGAGMIDEEPLFLDPGGYDLHLTRLSPCINRGTYLGAPAEDRDGEPRPWMGTVDLGADEFTGVHPLGADRFDLSVTGGTVIFDLDAGHSQDGRWYLILGSMSGSTPGTPLPLNGKTLPLSWDSFTESVLTKINSLTFTDFFRILDGAGKGTATIHSPVLRPGMIGKTMTYAYCLKGTPDWDFVSNPVGITFIP